MEYHWKGRPAKEGQESYNWNIQILSMDEFYKEYRKIAIRSFGTLKLSQVRYCKADQLNKGVAGFFAIPPKTDPSRQKTTFGYYLLEDQLIFVDESNFVEDTLNQMQKNQVADISSAALLLFEFMEYLWKDDMQYLLEYEENLTQMEEELLENRTNEFDQQILSVRRDLSALGGYYEQLSDVGELLEQNMKAHEKEKESQLFGMYADKAGRFFSTVQMMKEYTLQLREMHQTKVDMRQNEIMQLLTVVTTIFMPLTLIAGWYGMNFVNMPELQFRQGYPVVCVVCVVIVVLEIIFFWRKKWFK